MNLRSYLGCAISPVVPEISVRGGRVHCSGGVLCRSQLTTRRLVEKGPKLGPNVSICGYAVAVVVVSVLYRWCDLVAIAVSSLLRLGTEINFNPRFDCFNRPNNFMLGGLV